MICRAMKTTYEDYSSIFMYERKVHKLISLYLGLAKKLFDFNPITKYYRKILKKESSLVIGKICVTAIEIWFGVRLTWNKKALINL